MKKIRSVTGIHVAEFNLSIGAARARARHAFRNATDGDARSCRDAAVQLQDAQYYFGQAVADARAAGLPKKRIAGTRRMIEVAEARYAYRCGRGAR